MAGITTTSSPASSANRLQTYFSRTLLKRIEPELIFAQFGMKSPLPTKAGAKTIRFFKFQKPSTAGVQTLTEGTPIDSSNFKQLDSTYIDVALGQYGQVIATTDIVNNVDLFNLIEQSIQTNSLDNALHVDTIVRNELTFDYSSAGTPPTGVTTGLETKQYIYAGATSVAALTGGYMDSPSNATSYASTRNSGNYSSNCIMKPVLLLDAVTMLKNNRAPKIAGKYVAAVVPSVSRDLQNDKTVWQDINKYGNAEKIFNGEVGSIYGAKVVEHNNGFVAAATQGTTSATGNVYSTHVFGANAFGIPDLSNLGSPMAPQVTIVKGPDKSDPLNQRTLIGYKVYWATKVLQAGWIVEILSQTGFGQG